jgi:anti-anti-sigma regulatory factor
MRERTMTCEIERLDVGSNRTVLYVSGHIQADHFSMIEELIRRENGSVTLDLTEVTLVDRAAPWSFSESM